MKYSLFDILNEANSEIEKASVQEMRNIMGAKKTPAPPAIQKVKSHLANTDEFELYEFLDHCEFWEVTNKDSPGWYRTAGVRASSDKVEFYYDKEFIENISNKPGELMFLIAHEASHIFRYHQDRQQTQGKEPSLSNIAQDMVINHDIMATSDIGGFKPSFIEGGMKLPEEFKKDFKESKDAIYYENVYGWLQKNPDQQEQEPDRDGEPQEQDYWKEGSIVKVNSGPHKGEYRKITKVNEDGTLETEPVDIKKEYERVRKS